MVRHPACRSVVCRGRTEVGSFARDGARVTRSIGASDFVFDVHVQSRVPLTLCADLHHSAASATIEDRSTETFFDVDSLVLEESFGRRDDPSQRRHLDSLGDRRLGEHVKRHRVADDHARFIGRDFE